VADGRARHVSAQSFEALAVPAVDGRPDVYVDAAELGERLVERVERAHGVDELGRLLAGQYSQELPISNRRSIASRQRGLLVGERVDGIVKAVERATAARAVDGRGLAATTSVSRRHEDDPAIAVERLLVAIIDDRIALRELDR